MKENRFLYQKKLITFFWTPQHPGNQHVIFSQTTIHIIIWDFLE